MREHPESELHTCGKMFGVLMVEPSAISDQYSDNYLAAFSAKLDGSYFHEGFVPPVYAMTEEPVGHSKEESRRLQRLLFANYSFLNGKGESKNLLEIFANEKPIVPADEWFSSAVSNQPSAFRLPPSGAGECCAPKLLQYALTHGLKPLQLAEFWVGAPSKTEIRQEGAFYAPCSGRCVPILRHMLQGLEDLEISAFSNQYSVVSSPPEILFEDDYIIVINKPAGLLSVPGKTDEPSAESLLHAKPVHRLDQDTSGLLVLAKTPEVYKTLQSYFQRRDIYKRYEAVCKPNDKSPYGVSRSEEMSNHKSEGIINLPLLPNPYDRPRQMVDREHGKPAITRYVIRERRADGTMLVDFFPLTGRTHQLRVHAAHPEGLNAPIVGDRLYNASIINQQSPITNRLMLHAAEIRFVHPVTQQEMHFFANKFAYFKNL
jgi:tRNA pseudouridine32 synthase/23S rRNA pseudouridine746 synthase